MIATFLTLDDWINVALLDRVQRVHIQRSNQRDSIHGAVAVITTEIVVTSASERSGVLLARIIVERAELWTRERDMSDAVQQRAELAEKLVRAELVRTLHPSPEFVRGIIVAEKLLEILRKIRTDHDLWTLVAAPKEINDPAEQLIQRRLVPRSDLADKVADIII